MPMWCASSDTYDSTTFAVNSQPHHKIVRIPPGEAVVLNSAERAPYLLLIEILHDDLNFDPSKRGNREILRRIVSKENERIGASKELITFGHTRPRPSITVDSVVGSEQVLGNDSADVQDGGATNETDTPRGSNTVLPVSDDEEMDLVEQVYGEGQSLRGPLDLSETIVLPPTPKNRELELATWSRGSSLPSSPAVEQTAVLTSTASPRSIPARTPHLPDSLHSPSTSASGGERTLSLDEYSERMRTAAIMLAQLNASLVRETVTPLSKPAGHATDAIQGTAQEISPSSSGSLSWLTGSSWLGVGPSDGTTSGPVHPSLGGNRRLHDTTNTAPITRMRVQHAEAAAIRDRIMQEMLALEEERMARMREGEVGIGESGGRNMKTAEDEGILKRELSKVDPSAVVFSESWVAKKVCDSIHVVFTALLTPRSESNTAWIALWTPRCGTLDVFMRLLHELRYG